MFCICFASCGPYPERVSNYIKITDSTGTILYESSELYQNVFTTIENEGTISKGAIPYIKVTVSEIVGEYSRDVFVAHGMGLVVTWKKSYAEAKDGTK
jgi:hypothetical protein